ncbi:hypothetical protein RRG08_043440 [Elysia crispata]|uniref:Uncharacterized protein n=1 Tax=Elysia crispata TaxID=231223 RepID=A0AAE1D1B5_9GAST|nr:hypothetical protein RRG08_043440 [Elysia crispata]
MRFMLRRLHFTQTWRQFHRKSQRPVIKQHDIRSTSFIPDQSPLTREDLEKLDTTNSPLLFTARVNRQALISKTAHARSRMAEANHETTSPYCVTPTRAGKVTQSTDQFVAVPAPTIE